MSGCGCVPIKLYRQDQVAGWLWPSCHSLLSPWSRARASAGLPNPLRGSWGWNSGGIGREIKHNCIFNNLLQKLSICSLMKVANQPVTGAVPVTLALVEITGNFISHYSCGGYLKISLYS